jgi:hypothetical protein
MVFYDRRGDRPIFSAPRLTLRWPGLINTLSRLSAKAEFCLVQEMREIRQNLLEFARRGDYKK